MVKLAIAGTAQLKAKAEEKPGGKVRAWRFLGSWVSFQAGKKYGKSMRTSHCAVSSSHRALAFGSYAQ
eukprot:scaffold9514_cov35-Tisochrysis_lutea.AAC.7